MHISPMENLYWPFPTTFLTSVCSDSGFQEDLLLYLLIPSSLYSLRMDAMFASFWSWWTSSEHQSFDNDRQQLCSNFCQHPQNSLMVPWTWALPMSLKAPWLTSSTAGNFTHPDSSTWLRSRKEVRAEFIKKNQDNAEKNEVSNTVVTRFPAPLSCGPAFSFSSPHSWFQLQLSCGFPVTFSLSMHVSAKAFVPPPCSPCLLSPCLYFILVWALPGAPCYPSRPPAWSPMCWKGLSLCSKPLWPPEQSPMRSCQDQIYSSKSFQYLLDFTEFLTLNYCSTKLPEPFFFFLNHKKANLFNQINHTMPVFLLYILCCLLFLRALNKPGICVCKSFSK